MRTIDADKLSEHKFSRESAKGSDYMRGWNDAIDAIVDNAPTVCNDNYAMGYQDGVKKVLSERPHGKWEFFSIGNNQYSRCSICKDEHTSEDTDLDWWYDNFKYCPKCGARMMKETDNE